MRLSLQERICITVVGFILEGGFQSYSKAHLISPRSKFEFINTFTAAIIMKNALLLFGH